jgi:hypothetical protein
MAVTVCYMGQNVGFYIKRENRTKNEQVFNSSSWKLTEHMDNTDMKKEERHSIV